MPRPLGSKNKSTEELKVDAKLLKLKAEKKELEKKSKELKKKRQSP